MRKVGNVDIVSRYVGQIPIIERYSGSDLVWTAAPQAPQNLTLWSEEMQRADYLKARVTVTADAINDPNGLLTADLLLETADTNTHILTKIFNFPTIGLIYTFSVYAKAQDRTKLRLNLAQGAVSLVDFDLVAKTVNKEAGNIEELSDGWFRCSVTSPVIVTGNRDVSVRPLNDSGQESYLGDITKGIYLWGWQVNEGTLKPYAKTEGTIVP